MSRISPESLQDPGWHPWVRAERRPRRLRAEHVIPVLLIALFAWFGWWILASVVAAIALTLVVLAVAHPPARRRMDRWIGIFADWLARAVAVLLLAPVFYLVLMPIGLWGRVFGSDPLGLKRANAAGFWHEPDSEPRRNRHAARMFAVECRHHRRGTGMIPLAVLCVAGLLVIEGVLRLAGLGNPMLFVQDPEIAYYPAPNQSVRYPGRTITTNDAGMRADFDTTRDKQGRIRILMTGDSTLAGTKVGNHELYSAIVRDLLDERAGGEKFEVLNMGVNAWGPVHQAAYFRKFGTFEADVLVICGPVANVYRPGYGLERLPFRPVTNPPATAITHAGYEAMWRLRERVLGAPAWTIEGDAQDTQARRGGEAYHALAQTFQQAGADVVMEMLPARTTTLGQGADEFSLRHFQTIGQRMMETGVEPNLAGPIFADDPAPEKIYYDGIHFDAYGHRLYAEYLVERLIQSSPHVRSLIKD